MRVDGRSYVEAYAVLAKMNLHLEGGTSLISYRTRPSSGAWALGSCPHTIRENISRRT